MVCGGTVMLEKDCALKTIVDGDFTAKLLPEGYLSIRYKSYDCYGIAATEDLDEEKIKEVLGYVKSVYTYREETPLSLSNGNNSAADEGEVDIELYRQYGITRKKKKVNLKIQDQDFSETPDDLSFNYVWGTLNRVDKNILKNKVLAHLESQKLKEEFDRIELLVKYDIPYDIIKAVYYDIDEKELKIVYRRLTRTK